MLSALPKPEYPRPDLDRSARWATLNGEWDFATNDDATTITVPFAWETAASGVRRTWLERATYSRDLSVPAAWGDARVVLGFGAVHHVARVLVDDVQVGEHVGGYTAFEFDITEFVTAGSTHRLVVEVDAPADKREIPHGKQRSVPRDDYDGVSFTPTSGIWQSVWLEARERTHVRAISLRGDSLTGFDVTGDLVGDAPDGAAVTLTAGSSTLELTADARGVFAGRLELDDPQLWSPQHPHVYEVEIRVNGAVDATATAGLRRMETRGEEFYLNGKRLYIRGVLDQGYWSESGPTAPSDEALLRDIDLARELGFNLVRKHLKFEEPRWLDYADRTGMLVWAEPACTSRFTPESAAAFEEQIVPMVERDSNHPSIIVWGLYNEEWGLDWDIPGSPERAAAASHAYDALKAIDDSRPIVENSGWAHVRSDIVDWHYYDEDAASWAANLEALATGGRHDWAVKLGPDFVVDKSLYGSADFPRTGVPIMNSEFGAGFTSLERAWHVRWQTQEIRRHDRFAGYVYTELTDVEHEMAGLLDTERRPKDWGGLNPADAFAPTVLVVDIVPRHAGADIEVPTAPLVVGVRVSHHGESRVEGEVHAAWVAAGRPFGADVAADVSAPVSAEPFRVTDAVSLELPTPGGPARLLLWLVVDGAVLARTFIDAAPIEEPNRRGARTR